MNSFERVFNNSPKKSHTWNTGKSHDDYEHVKITDKECIKNEKDFLITSGKCSHCLKCRRLYVKRRLENNICELCRNIAKRLDSYTIADEGFAKKYTGKHGC